jgi:hypothetical protein
MFHLFLQGSEWLVSDRFIMIGALLFFLCLWNGLAGYMLVNMPSRIVIQPENMRIYWRKRHLKQYQWDDIAVKKIGFASSPYVIVHDPAWRWSNYHLPRVLICELSKMQNG